VVNDQFAGSAAVIDQTKSIANAQFEASLRDIVENV
jgi:hypothetical protein